MEMGGLFDELVVLEIRAHWFGVLGLRKMGLWSRESRSR